MFTTGETVGLAEWIIDDTRLDIIILRFANKEQRSRKFHSDSLSFHIRSKEENTLNDQLSLKRVS